jgi:REP element-mobilizing transposase RayT
MRRARLTWPGAYHHVMNRGINGEAIFSADRHKKRFIEILQESATIFKMRIFAYCLMENHYHLLLENSSGKLSGFMKRLNGTYGFYYRHEKKSRGYVFQNRFKSTLIENDAYLLQAIRYTLFNPVRKGIVGSEREWPWSSATLYFRAPSSPWLDLKFVEELFDGEANLFNRRGTPELTVYKTEWGDLLGADGFLENAVMHYERRSERFSLERNRLDDRHFEPVEKVVREFERMTGMRMEEMDTGTYPGKILRRKLLVLLKERAGITYAEIAKMDLFSDLQAGSLRSIFRSGRGKW